MSKPVENVDREDVEDVIWCEDMSRQEAERNRKKVREMQAEAYVRQFKARQEEQQKVHEEKERRRAVLRSARKAERREQINGRRREAFRKKNPLPIPKSGFVLDVSVRLVNNPLLKKEVGLHQGRKLDRKLRSTIVIEEIEKSVEFNVVTMPDGVEVGEIKSI